MIKSPKVGDVVWVWTGRLTSSENEPILRQYTVMNIIPVENPSKRLYRLCACDDSESVRYTARTSTLFATKEEGEKDMLKCKLQGTLPFGIFSDNYCKNTRGE